MKRKAKISRKTKETNINVDLNIDGKGKYKIETGIGFLNHMLEQLSKHSSMDIKKPLPVSILYFPLPSIFKSTLMLVSLVFLLIFAFLFIISKRYISIIQLWQ